MPEPVVEHELVARKGRKQTKLRLRVFAPIPHGNDAWCSFELRAGTRLLWSPDRPSHGVDSLQALMLALRIAALHLLYFEMETGMRIDAWQWSDLIDLIGDSPISTHARDRVNEIKLRLRELMRDFRDEHEPRAARRKPRTASRSRSR